jgi:NADH:ubiquinone oxidoreductase subunit 5 (chain L)/Multisubunit Na+/H+ antiporter, MnhA subunit
LDSRSLFTADARLKRSRSSCCVAKFYFDEFYGWLIYWTQELLARVAAFIDRWVIDAGAVGGSSRGTWGIGALLRLIQVGNLQAYAFLFGLGVVALIYFAVMR